MRAVVSAASSSLAVRTTGMAYLKGKKNRVDNRRKYEQNKNLIWRAAACRQWRICAAGSGGSSARRRRGTGSCRSASPRSTGRCPAAGWRWVRCTRFSAPAATRRTAPSPPGLPPASSPGSAPARCCGAGSGPTFTARASPPSGSTRAASSLPRRRATKRSCGRPNRGCWPANAPGSPRWSARSAGCRWWRGAGCSSPPSVPASPSCCCGAGAAAARRRPSAAGRARRRRAGGAAGRRRGGWRVRMRRVLYVFLPNWPIDRNRGSGPAPFARIAASGGRLALAAVNPAAAAAGLAPGMPLADALSFVPGLATAPAAPAEDAAALRRLAEWCRRYSPWTAPDGIDGIKLEITGCAHLWGGEAALAADLAARLGRRGLGHRLAIAGTLGAAWALARFADRTPALAAPGTERAALAPLPVEALRLDPATAAGLRRVGLARIGEVAAMPRDTLARRFGAAVARRLDQAEGAA